ncbi:hypothetical protein [Acidipropionibacterium acidipropionici]|nr:hypothetical protein [Acidipropionibacterium acidipropionici]
MGEPDEYAGAGDPVTAALTALADGLSGEHTPQTGHDLIESGAWTW